MNASKRVYYSPMVFPSTSKCNEDGKPLFAIIIIKKAGTQKPKSSKSEGFSMSFGVNMKDG